MTAHMTDLDRDWVRARLHRDPEATIADFADELRGIDSGMLDGRERMQLRAFRAAYAAARALRRRPQLSDVLRPGAPDIVARQKPRMGVAGPTAETAGGHHLDRAQQARFDRLGVVGPFDLELGESRRAGLVDVARRAPAIYPHLLHPELMQLALSPQITERVASLLGPEVDIVRSSVFVKQAGDGRDFSRWHMAPSSNYGAEERAGETDYVTVWIALTPARAINGCLKLLPGSFAAYPNGLLLDAANLAVYFDDPFDAFLAACIKRKLGAHNSGTPRSAFDEFIGDRVNGSVIIQKLMTTNDFLYEEIRRRQLSSVLLECEPSQFFIFSSENYHGSVPNLSADARVAFVVRYGTPRSPMNRTKYVRTLIDNLPIGLRSRLDSPDQDMLVPVTRALGAAKHGRDGLRMYLTPNELGA